MNQALYINGSEYHHAAIMYGSGAHFCCTTMVKGRPIFYDGMKSCRLPRLTINKLGPHSLTEPITTSSRSSTFEQEKDIDRPSRTYSEDDEVMGTGVEEKPKQKTRYPMGLSTDIVGPNGRTPVCRGCGQTIDRGSQHLILRTSVNAAKFWTTTTSFHFNEGCIRDERGSAKESKALISPLISSPYQLSTSSPSKTKRQRAKRRAVLRELSTSLGPA
ncbi:MAG: hypothetical protein BYD32DRAFT_413340, partial [Podila humilis]